MLLSNGSNIFWLSQFGSIGDGASQVVTTVEISSNPFVFNLNATCAAVNGFAKVMVYICVLATCNMESYAIPTNRNQGRSILARALKTHRFHSTYVGRVRKTSLCPTSTIQHHPNHGMIVSPIWMETMASMLVIPWLQPREHITLSLPTCDQKVKR